MDNTGTGSTPNDSCTLAKVNFEGWLAFELADGLVQVFVVPEIGGRIIPLRLKLLLLPSEFICPHNRPTRGSKTRR